MDVDGSHRHRSPSSPGGHASHRLAHDGQRHERSNGPHSGIAVARKRCIPFDAISRRAVAQERSLKSGRSRARAQEPSFKNRRSRTEAQGARGAPAHPALLLFDASRSRRISMPLPVLLVLVLPLSPLSLLPPPSPPFGWPPAPSNDRRGGGGAIDLASWWLDALGLSFSPPASRGGVGGRMSCKSSCVSEPPDVPSSPGALIHASSKSSSGSAQSPHRACAHASAWEGRYAGRGRAQHSTAYALKGGG